MEAFEASGRFTLPHLHDVGSVTLKMATFTMKKIAYKESSTSLPNDETGRSRVYIPPGLRGSFSPHYRLPQWSPPHLRRDLHVASPHKLPPLMQIPISRQFLLRLTTHRLHIYDNGGVRPHPAAEIILSRTVTCNLAPPMLRQTAI